MMRQKMPRPSIADAYAKNRTAFILRTPFGVLLPEDQHALIRATARDAGVATQAVLDEVSANV